MKKILILIIIITSLIACSKDNMIIPEPTCRFYCFLSYKYDLSYNYLTTDTLAGKDNMTIICGRDLDSCKAYKPYVMDLCDINNNKKGYEYREYIFNKEIVKPHKLKN